MLERLLALVYLLAFAGLAFYGALGILTLLLYWRHRHETNPSPRVPRRGDELPPVTVQLPIYNERFVVDRLIHSVANLRYPSDSLEIQVIDDSSDDTTARAAELVDRYRQEGINISLLRRAQREGYKAGALAAAAEQATGDYFVIFDADFQPQPDFLYRTIPHFLGARDLGVIQTRWGHLNAFDSLLTAAQALALDKHFAIEQTVRYRARLFPKFNGTAGVWRRRCLEDAGGWESDTVCEDLCLSTRAVLKGWRFRFLPDVVAPAELPPTISAYKNQQARWAKGSMQCLLKFGRAILTSRNHSFLARAYALLSMAAHGTSLLLITLLLLHVPLLYFQVRLPAELSVLSVAGLGQPLLFLLGQQVLYPDWKRRAVRLPALLLVAIGLSASIGRAIIQAIVSRRHVFVRTPKRGEKSSAERYRLPFDWIILVELFLAAYAAAGLLLALWRGSLGSLLFLASCVLAFGYVALASLPD